MCYILHTFRLQKISPSLKLDIAGEFVKRIRLSISSFSHVMLGDLEVKSNRRHSCPLAPLAPGCPNSHRQLQDHTTSYTQTHTHSKHGTVQQLFNS